MSKARARYSRMVTKAVDSLRWYRRSRPDALRHVFAPGFVTLFTLLVALVWGQPQLILLAVLFAAAFMLLAGELTGELRDLEADVRSAAAAKSEIVPVLAQLVGERPPEADVEREPAPDSEPKPLLSLPALPDDTQPSTLSLITGPPPTSGSSAPPAVKHVPSPEPAEDRFHEVREPATGLVLHTCRSFLDACDFAFDHLDESDPDELEIVLATGDSRMRVWWYSRSDATTAQEIIDGQRASRR